MTCLASGHCAAGWPAKKAAIAFFEQSLRSLVTTEWPVNGTATSCAPGIRAATLGGVLDAACAGRTPPERIRVGTGGSGAGGAGGGLALGQATQTGTDSLRSATR